MPKKKFIDNQSGFGLIGIMLAVVVLVIAAFAGLQLMKRHFESLRQSYTQNNRNNNSSDNQFSNPNGDLAACQGTDLFSVSPAVDGTYDYINPLGQTSSNNGNAAHVFPTDHIYFTFRHMQPGNLQSPALPAKVVAPADGEIFGIADVSYKSGSISYHNYRIEFAPCSGVDVRLDHITTLSPNLQSAMEKADKSCQDSYTTGGPNSPTYTPCDYKLNLKVKAGDSIGTSGSPDAPDLGSFDFDVYDRRQDPLPFIDSKYVTNDEQHAVCAISYYPEGPVKTALFNNLKTTKVDQKGRKDCGTNMWDKLGTIQGNWIIPGTPVGQMSGGGINALAIIHYNLDPSLGSIDWGGVIAPADHIIFPIQTSGITDRDPAELTADGKIYCYSGKTLNGASHTLYIQLMDSNTLKIEHHSGTSCPVSPSFSNPTTYVR
ncbi:MAG: hypothetical protein M1142_03205 [Patescibacteria group bacterium]|nr:hypothetical protein [Patescibacteria group bacterium]